MKTVQLEMFKGSNSLDYILDKKEFVINFVDNSAYYFGVLYDKKQISFSNANIVEAPVLTDSLAYIEARLSNYKEQTQSCIIEANIVNIKVISNPKLFNQAENLVIESLIISTRINHMPEGKAEGILKENYRVIKKVAPKSSFVDTMEKLLNKCGFLLEE